MRNKLIVPILATEFVFFIVLILLVSVKAALAIFSGTIVLILVFFNPFAGIMIYLMMLYLRPQEFVAGLTGFPLMKILALGIIGTFFLHNAVNKKPFTALKIRQSLLMIVFLLLIPLSQLQRFFLTGAKDAFMQFLPVFMMFFMIINLITDFDRLKKVFLLLLYMTLFLAANGILQYYRGVDIAGETPIEGGRIRWIGIFNDPNDLGLAILSFTPFAILNFMKKKKHVLKRLLWLIVLGVLVYALYLTNSRGTFLGLLAVAVYYLVRRLGTVKGLVVGAAIAALLFAAGPSRMADISPEEASASGRIDAWATGLNLLQWRPLLGVGFGSFIEYHHLTAHNSVVLCVAELGLVGLFVWLFLIISSFTDMSVVYAHGRDTEFAFYAETLQLSILGFFVSAFFLSRTYNDVLFILIGLAALLSFLAQREFNYRVLRFKRKTVITVFVSEIGLVVLVKALVMIS
jgi:O-antigen ligase